MGKPVPDIFAKVNKLRKEADEAWNKAFAAPTQEARAAMGALTRKLEDAWREEALRISRPFRSKKHRRKEESLR